MVRCKPILTKLEDDISGLKECGKDKSIVGRVARYIEFKKHFSLPDDFYTYTNEGLLRQIVAKWHKGVNVEKEVAEIRKALANVDKVCETKVKEAEEKKKALEIVAKDSKLTKVQKKDLEEAQTIIKTRKVPDITKEMQKEVKKVIQDLTPMAKGEPKVTVALHFGTNEYEGLEKHFFENAKPKSKTDFAQRLESYLINLVHESIAKKTGIFKKPK